MQRRVRKTVLLTVQVGIVLRNRSNSLARSSAADFFQQLVDGGSITSVFPRGAYYTARESYLSAELCVFWGGLEDVTRFHSAIGRKDAWLCV
jgi:hypothetical protein